jgi:hypothetical protein
MKVPKEVLAAGGVVPVVYVTEGKKAGVTTATKADLKKVAKASKSKK